MTSQSLTPSPVTVMLEWAVLVVVVVVSVRLSPEMNCVPLNVTEAEMESVIAMLAEMGVTVRGQSSPLQRGGPVTQLRELVSRLRDDVEEEKKNRRHDTDGSS